MNASDIIRAMRTALQSRGDLDLAADLARAETMTHRLEVTLDEITAEAMEDMAIQEAASGRLAGRAANVNTRITGLFGEHPSC